MNVSFFFTKRLLYLKKLFLLLPGGIHFLFNPSFKKFPGTQHLVNALAVVAAAGKFMCATRVPYILYRPPQYLQAAVEHFALHKTGTPVVIAMKNNIGRSNMHQKNR